MQAILALATRYWDLGDALAAPCEWPGDKFILTEKQMKLGKGISEIFKREDLAGKNLDEQKLGLLVRAGRLDHRIAYALLPCAPKVPKPWLGFAVKTAREAIKDEKPLEDVITLAVEAAQQEPPPTPPRMTKREREALERAEQERQRADAAEERVAVAAEKLVLLEKEKRDALAEADLRLHAAQRCIEEAERRAQDAEHRAQPAPDQEADLLHRLEEAERRAEQERRAAAAYAEAARAAVARAEAAERQVAEAQATAARAEQAAQEAMARAAAVEQRAADAERRATWSANQVPARATSAVVPVQTVGNAHVTASDMDSTLHPCEKENCDGFWHQISDKGRGTSRRCPVVLRELMAKQPGAAMNGGQSAPGPRIQPPTNIPRDQYREECNRRRRAGLIVHDPGGRYEGVAKQFGAIEEKDRYGRTVAWLVESPEVKAEFVAYMEQQDAASQGQGPTRIGSILGAVLPGDQVQDADGRVLTTIPRMSGNNGNGHSPSHSPESDPSQRPDRDVVFDCKGNLVGKGRLSRQEHEYACREYGLPLTATDEEIVEACARRRRQMRGEE